MRGPTFRQHMKYTSKRTDHEAARALNMISAGLLLTDAPSKLAERYRQGQMTIVFKDDVKSMNSEFGSRCKKTLEGIRQELSSRGFDWTILCDNAVSVRIGQCLFRIRQKAGIDVDLAYSDPDCTSGYQHCTAVEVEIVDLLESIAEVDRRSCELLEQRRLQARKDDMVSQVDLPSVELMVEEHLGPRGIRYNLFHSDTDNVLEIQIIKEIWMAKAVSFETLEADLRLVPYLISRPDRIKQDGRGFAVFKKWDWNRK